MDYLGISLENISLEDVIDEETNTLGISLEEMETSLNAQDLSKHIFEFDDEFIFSLKESDEPLAVVSPEEPTQPLHTSTPKKPIHTSKTGKGRPVRRLLKLKKTGEVQRLQPCRR
ncbi:uncharacterized protein LOC128240138 [Mya arenaria]|uniref:uncharacterized protein LOC128240138 n=1 Tax=Mya arenaria TaxID=6604 RepID=UPI0022E2541B|nr:uncharacterized protein LOC128240138 [Mya arenaria]